MNAIEYRGVFKTSVFGKAIRDLWEETGFRPFLQEPCPLDQRSALTVWERFYINPIFDAGTDLPKHRMAFDIPLVSEDVFRGGHGTYHYQ
jgi:hypothetical protein